MLIVSLDMGSSGAKAALIDGAGVHHHTSFRRYQTISIPGGGSEQSPEDWVTAAREAILDLPGGYDAIALTGQMQDLLFLDRGGIPLGNAILYNDTRAVSQAARLNEQIGDWYQRTGNVQSATSQAAQYRLHAPSRPSAARLLLGPPGYIASLLGVGYHCDITTASATGLFNLAAREWDAEILRAAGISPDMLPEVSTGLVGTAAESNVLGVPGGTPVILAPGDAAATTTGIVGTDPGDDYVSLGTSGWHARITTRLQDSPSATHQLALPTDSVLRISSVLSVGGTADWARERFLPGVSAKDADALMMQRRREPTGMVSLPSLRGERFPVHSDQIGAAITGIRAGADNLDLYVAVIEGICMTLGQAITGNDTLAAAGGGAKSIPWMRLLADVTGRPIHVTHSSDATTHGAASFAATVLGRSPLEPLAEKALVLIEPEEANTATYAELMRRQRQLFEVLA